MKRNVLAASLLLVLNSAFAQQLNYTVLSDSAVYNDEIEAVGAERIFNLSTGDTVQIMPTNEEIYYFFDVLYHKSMQIKYDNKTGYLDFKKIASLDKNTHRRFGKFFDKYLVPVYYCDSVYGKSLAPIAEHENFKAGYEKIRNTFDEPEEPWFYNYYFRLYYLNDVCFRFSSYPSRYGFYGYIVGSTDTYIEVYIERVFEDEFNLQENSKEFDKGKIYKFNYSLDGDYLKLYYNNALFMDAAYVDYATADYMSEFIKYNSELDETGDLGPVKLSQVTWPRHADGTCDYDGSVKPAVSKSTFSAIPVSGTTKRVTTNLRLRSTEDTSSNVITTMQKGTSVKIIKTGSQDTIDGITSNWVQVEVQAGAKDRNGKSITAGTTGWCFGGYLE
jgi:hypothetical protein